MSVQIVAPDTRAAQSVREAALPHDFAENIAIHELDAIAGQYSGLRCDGCIISTSTFLQADMTDVRLLDCRIDNTDLSAVKCGGAIMARLEIVSCRASGIDFARAELQDVVFKDCRLDMANFRQAKLKSVRFIDCVMNESDFGGAKLHKVEYDHCTLDESRFDAATCKKVDLRSSQLLNLHGWSGLKGATIDATQLVNAAPFLAAEYGLKIEE